jgi:hypothetical protein
MVPEEAKPAMAIAVAVSECGHMVVATKMERPGIRVEGLLGKLEELLEEAILRHIPPRAS